MVVSREGAPGPPVVVRGGDRTPEQPGTPEIVSRYRKSKGWGEKLIVSPQSTGIAGITGVDMESGIMSNC